MKKITKQYAQNLIEQLKENDSVHGEVVRYSLLSRVLFGQTNKEHINLRYKPSDTIKQPISAASGNSLEDFKEYLENSWKIHECLYQYMSLQDFERRLGEITEEL